MPQATIRDRIPLVDNPSARELYADEAVGFFISENLLRITFANARVDHGVAPAAKSRVVSGRVILPLAAAEALQKGLADFISQLKGQTANGGHPAFRTLQ